jgi:DNA replication and repair protein RecF
MFRNLAPAQLSLQRGLNVIWGANAQGKTNLLEAAYYLATGRSFRTSRDEECLPFNSDPAASAILEGRLIRGGIRHDIEVSVSRRGKAVRVDEKTLPRLTDLWGVLATVLFTPDDLRMVGGGPAGRRQWIDIALSQVDHYYLDALKRFSRALRQRNALLRPPSRSARIDRSQVEAYEGPLAQAAGRILVGRRDFLSRIQPLAARRHAELARGDEPLDFRYDHFLQPVLSREGIELGQLNDTRAADLYAVLLASRRDEDLARGQTTRGPHRDDVTLLLQDHEARAYASQGQTRTLALSLRLAEVDFIRNTLGHSPLLLLDDILSELDPDRLTWLLSSLANAEIQTILTTTDLGPLRPYLGEAKAWNMQAGKVQPTAPDNPEL